MEDNLVLHNAALCYLFLYVSDLAASRRYYEEKLGFRSIEEDAVAAKYGAGKTLPKIQ